MPSQKGESKEVIGRWRLPWEDQFHAPTLDQVRSHYQGQSLELFDRLLHTFRELPGLEESFGWTGLPWRWAWTYRAAGEPERPWSVLVPDPEAPRVSLPLTVDVFDAMPARMLSRYLRDGIATAVQVGDVRWPEWAVATPAHLSDICAAVAHKHKLTVGAGR